MARGNELAYDYSIYENLPEKLSEKKIQLKKNPSQNQPVLKVKCIMIATTALVILCAIIYGKLEISKLYAQSADLNSDLNVVVSENMKYETDVESKTSVQAVEDYAINVLGLKKLDRTQIEYIELQKDNVIEVINDKDPNVFVSIKNWFEGVLEYIGV